MNATQVARRAIRGWRPELLYPTPVSGLQPERLYAYLDALYQRRTLPGTVLEVGCWLGGTAAVAARMLARVGSVQPYQVIDTFGGFVPDQFATDVEHGTPRELAAEFSDSSVGTVRRLLTCWGAGQVRVTQGDIATVGDGALPDTVAVALVDVDLEVPVYAACERLWPRLVPGGVILIDDCPDVTSWAGALVGYRRFVDAVGRPEEVRFGMGWLRRE